MSRSEPSNGWFRSEGKAFLLDKQNGTSTFYPFIVRLKLPDSIAVDFCDKRTDNYVCPFVCRPYVFEPFLIFFGNGRETPFLENNGFDYENENHHVSHV